LRLGDFARDIFYRPNLYFDCHTSEAESIYQSLPAKIQRIGTQDCRIAAIARANKFSRVTINVNDFVSVGLADVEDWTRN
jgi:tRNA(fMet)-specific endonuclease VapC